MKTKEEILEGKFICLTSDKKEVVFSGNTPLNTARKIIELYENKKRIVLDYGDIKTGESWNEIYDISGKIGMTKGHYNLRYPILLHNTRSMGGCMILTNCILSIKESKGKKLTFKTK